VVVLKSWHAFAQITQNWSQGPGLDWWPVFGGRGVQALCQETDQKRFGRHQGRASDLPWEDASGVWDRWKMTGAFWSRTS